MFISLLTDFGLTQEYAGVMKAVILSLCPSAQIVDISHDVPSYDIEEGRFMLQNFVKYSPVGIHVAVVDPGVGTERRGIIIETERGDFLVGPDNGILTGAEDFLGFKRAVVLENEKYMLKKVSSSFHGRDVFAPAAGYLARGVSLEEFGREIEKKEIQRVEISEYTEDERKIRGHVLRIDRFGNVQFTIRAGLLPKKRRVTLSIGGKQVVVPFVKTFGEVNPGEFLLYEDSDGLLTLSVNQGDAARLLKIEKKMEVLIRKDL